MGPGYKHVGSIFADTMGSLVDRTEFGISGLIHALGDYEDSSKITLFFLSIIYIPLAIVGLAEFILRIPLGFVALIPLTLLHLALVIVGTIINLVLMLILRIVELFTQK
jgi:hypothetical protein